MRCPTAHRAPPTPRRGQTQTERPTAARAQGRGRAEPLTSRCPTWHFSHVGLDSSHLTLRRRQVKHPERERCPPGSGAVAVPAWLAVSAAVVPIDSAVDKGFAPPPKNARNGSIMISGLVDMVVVGGVAVSIRQSVGTSTAVGGNGSTMVLWRPKCRVLGGVVGEAKGWRGMTTCRALEASGLWVAVGCGWWAVGACLGLSQPRVRSRDEATGVQGRGAGGVASQDGGSNAASAASYYNLRYIINRLAWLCPLPSFSLTALSSLLTCPFSNDRHEPRRTKRARQALLPPARARVWQGKAFAHVLRGEPH